jgi:hypothetical protein
MPGCWVELNADGQGVLAGHRSEHRAVFAYQMEA